MPKRRRTYLINRKFQLRFSFYVCSWLIALNLAYPLIISSVFDYFIRYMVSDPMGPGLATLEKTREDLFILLMLMQIVMLSLAFLISIFMSHKIAGPLYKLHRFFTEAKEGNLKQTLAFRKKDYFQELVPAYNEMMTNIRRQLEMKETAIDLAILELEKNLSKASPELRPELEEILSELQEAQK